MAQVYSVNAVGYVNLTLKPKFNLVANQLIRSPDSKLNTLFPAVPTESQVFTYSGGLYKADIFDGSSGKWVDANSGEDSTTTLNPGQGFFFYNAANPAADITVTLVGDVPQGDVGITYGQFFTLSASKVPQQITLNPANGLPDKLEGQFLSYNATAQNYDTALINDGGPFTPGPNGPFGWVDSQTGLAANATVTVGQGFFLYNPNATPWVWTRTFSVN
jgi:hypothetical protein